MDNDIYQLPEGTLKRPGIPALIPLYQLQQVKAERGKTTDSRVLALRISGILGLNSSDRQCGTTPTTE